MLIEDAGRDLTGRIEGDAGWREVEVQSTDLQCFPVRIIPVDRDPNPPRLRKQTVDEAWYVAEASDPSIESQSVQIPSVS
jgi:hypothetical protein